MITWLLLLTVLFLAKGDYTTQVNPDVTWGVWEGWGCSLAWWGQAFGNQDDLADLIFSSNIVNINGIQLPGLNMNIARYNAGACSWNAYGGASMVPSSNIFPARQMEGYWLDWASTDPSSASWNWTVDVNQRAILQKAQERGANLFELFSNSPMWWMCANHNPSGASNCANNLESWNYEQHAYYLATIAKYAQENWDITFASVELFNEPSSSWWCANNNQEGCHFDPSTQAQVIPYLRQALNNYSLNSIMISASDENQYDEALSTWNSFAPGTQADVGRVNTHGYQYQGGRRDLLYQAVVVNSQKKLWNSEYGDGDASGYSLASNLNLDFIWLHNTAWVYWQPFDGEGWGFVVSDISTNVIGAPAKKYYVMAQYTRHIRPGMTIISGGSDSNTIAAYDGGAGKLVILTVNYGTAQTVTYDLSSFSAVKGPITRWETDFYGSVNYTMSTDTDLNGNTFSVSFNANTIQTFEVDGVLNSSV